MLRGVSTNLFPKAARVLSQSSSAAASLPTLSCPSASMRYCVGAQALWTAFRWQSTPTPTTPATRTCPFTGQTVLPSTTTTCPIMGAQPALDCPVEVELLNVSEMRAITGQMGKTRLSAFVTATAVVGYVISGGTSVVVAGALTVGTMLQSCSANTANQMIEVEHDKKMKRTRRRPLPTNRISMTGAGLICAGELAVGTAVLYAVSPCAALLGVANWALYVGAYTPLKRVSPINTWVGSIVGGVPPVMGGAAATGLLTGPLMAPSYLFGILLLAWQIPHFMGLAFHCRRDYEAAGYKMLAFVNPWRASFWAVLMSVFMAALTLAGPALIGMPVEGSWYYPVTVMANVLMIYKAYRFHMDPVKYCRGCFVFSYLYLTVMMGVYLVNHFRPVEAITYLCDRVFSSGAARIDTKDALVNEQA